LRSTVRRAGAFTGSLYRVARMRRIREGDRREPHQRSVAGGIAVEVMQDRALALPPLNRYLVGNMIDGTRIGKILGAFKNLPPIDRGELENILLRVSELVCEIPEIREMDINPLVADEQGVIALDARIIVQKVKPDTRSYRHMAIMPYPTRMVKNAELTDGTAVVIRPVRPEDAEMQQQFVRNLSEESRYNRYMSSIKQLSQTMLVRFTQLDYDREMALAMIRLEDGGKEEQLAVARFITDPDNEACEFALEVADRWQGRGIGFILMSALFDAARAQGLKIMRGEVLAGNKGMLKLMHKLGFTVVTHPEDRALTIVTKQLAEQPPQGAVYLSACKIREKCPKIVGFSTFPFLIKDNRHGSDSSGTRRLQEPSVLQHRGDRFPQPS